MSRLATLAPPPVASVQRRAGAMLAGAVLGAGFTAALFLGMALLEGRAPEAPPPDIADLRAVAMPETPPPPPEQQRESNAEPTILPGLEALASESPVRVAVPPPDIAALLPPPPAAPPATIQVGRLHTDLKPKLDTGEFRDRIYQMAEVDQLPRVLNRVNPRIPPWVRKDAAILRTTLLFTVETNGEIKNIRLASSSGNAQFDAIITEMIREWAFSPAVRRGRKVRCLLQQAITVKWSGGSVFDVN